MVRLCQPLYHVKILRRKLTLSSQMTWSVITNCTFGEMYDCVDVDFIKVKLTEGGVVFELKS